MGTKKKQSKLKGNSYNGRPGPYTPEKRREAVEAYLKSGMTYEEFGKVWGINGRCTLWKWVKIYKEKGPKGLENGLYGSHEKKKGAPRSVTEPVREEIAKVKIGNPGFGFKRIKNFLWRFRGLKVSTGTVRKTLIEKNLPKSTQVRRKPKRHKKVQRFERARPMQLWQSDITSFVLARHSSRVYLVAFMDDYSRYVVSWGLHLRQTGDVVIGALQEGIQRFGKPEEVLTDQGRQYYSWRGKSDFGKLLVKEGIRHVLSRSHHPQTLGKCERFWETVGQEFWERVHPQELADTRERFAHFIAHYNHFRPHQGIDGMVPADRFFGLESEVRKVLEQTFKQNEIRLAVGEAPRSPVFLVGQIGDQPLSLHGESGKLVLQTDGVTKTLESVVFGHLKKDLKKEEEKNERNNGPEKNENISISEEASAIGKTPLGAGDKGGSEQGAPNCDIINRILVTENGEHRCGESAQCSPSTALAVIEERSFGDGCGVTPPTQEKAGSQGRSENIEEKDPAIGSGSSDATETDPNNSGTSGSEMQKNSSGETCKPQDNSNTNGKSQ